MIQNIVFDMGRVLIHYQPPEYVKPFVKEEADQRLLLNAIFDAPDWPDNDRGTVTYEEFLERIRSRTPERLYHAAEQVWKNWILYLTPIPETNQLAMELKRCGYRLFLLSNVSTRYYEFRKTIMAIDNFDGEFLSAEVHRIKPDPEIYRLFFQRFALNPEECFFIDDNPDNIEAARKLGMPGFCYGQDIAELRRALADAGIRVKTESGK